MAAEWLAKGIQLSKIHQQIMTQRELLLQEGEATAQDDDGADMIMVHEERQDTAHRSSTRTQTEHLLKDIADAAKELNDLSCSTNGHFDTLKNNYWSMVRSILPVWEEDLLDYRMRQQHTNKKA